MSRITRIAGLLLVLGAAISLSACGFGPKHPQDYGKAPVASKDKVPAGLDKHLVRIDRSKFFDGPFELTPEDYNYEAPPRGGPRSAVELLGESRPGYFRLRAVRIKVDRPLPRRVLRLRGRQQEIIDPKSERYAPRIAKIDGTPPPVRFLLGYYGTGYNPPSDSSSSIVGEPVYNGARIVGRRPSGSSGSREPGRWTTTRYILFSKNDVLQDGAWQTYLLSRPVNLPKTPPSLFPEIYPKGVEYFVEVIYENKNHLQFYDERVYVPEPDDFDSVSLRGGKVFRIR